MEPGYTAAWGFWIAMFVVIEGAAIARREEGDTLSEHLRSWFATKGKPKWWLARRAVLGAALVWFALHLFTGAV